MNPQAVYDAILLALLGSLIFTFNAQADGTLHLSPPPVEGDEVILVDGTVTVTDGIGYIRRDDTVTVTDGIEIIHKRVDQNQAWVEE